MTFAMLNMNGFLYFLKLNHFFFGIIWIGHLYYFNFTQTPFMAEADAATKSGVVQKLVPRALWWFRWGAMFTFITGVLMLVGKSHQMPDYWTTPTNAAIFSGAILGTIMFLNVWLIIWPNQKIIIQNAVDVAAGKAANPAVAASASKAGLASRTNVLFSLPMLFFMGAGRNINFEFQTMGTYLIAFLVIVGLLELNAIKGKMGPLATVRGVIHMSVALTVVLYVLIEMTTK